MFIKIIVKTTTYYLIETHNQWNYRNRAVWESITAYETYVPFCKVKKFNYYSEIEAWREDKWNLVCTILDFYLFNR